MTIAATSTERLQARIVGSAVRRKEDHRLLTGQGRFVSNLTLPGLLHVAFLRSPYAHATICSVDVAAAEGLRGVHAVFEGKRPDFASVSIEAKSGLPGFAETVVPVLAWEKARFAGEPIAAVVAESRYVAEDALALIEVEYELLPAAVVARVGAEVPVHASAPDNVLVERQFEAGDVDVALATASVVVKRELTTNRHAANPMECRAAVALWESGNGRLTLWSGTQIPHLLRQKLAELLGMSEGRIRVIAPDVGGGFGVKAVVYPEDVALCLIARAMPGRPVKWVEDRSEHLRAAAHAREHRYELRAGFSVDGELLALEADITVNVGAYSLHPWTAGIEPLMAGGLLSGPYRLDNYRCTTRGIATNTAPVGPYRGVARPASVFAMETILNAAARELGMRPEEIRRRNLIRPEDVPYQMPTRVIDDSGNYGACLERALELFDVPAFLGEQRHRRATGEPPIGMGIACYNELTGLGRRTPAGPRMEFRTGHDACSVRVNPDGGVSVFSGTCAQGQGLETTIAQVVADELGVAYDDVHVRLGDTESCLWGIGAFSSRQAVIGGGAAHLAAKAVKEAVLGLAAALLDVSGEDLVLDNGRVCPLGGQEPLISLADVARVAYLETHRLPDGFEPGLEATRFYDPMFGAFAAGAQVGSVEVDTETGELTILKWVCVEDPGNVINPQIVNGQIVGAVAQGVGGAMFEHLVYDEDGTLITGTLMDYPMPTAAEMPDVILDHVAKPADNPLGVRGVGEGGTLGPSAVIAAAVADALGLEIDSLPITPSAILTAFYDEKPTR